MGSTSLGALYKKAKDDGAFSDVIPDGDFRLKILRANAGEAKASGAPRLGVQFKVTGDEDGQPLHDDDEAKDASSWVNLNFSDKAAPISFRQLREWGFDDEWLSETETVQQIADALLGIEIAATVGHRNWGKNEENVDNTIKVLYIVTPPAVGAAPVVETAEIVEDDEAY